MGKKSNNSSLGNIMNTFPSYGDSFGILNDTDNNLFIQDSTINYPTCNQARIEDITFMEYDLVPSTLRNHLENDLEPLNAELLQELLGANDSYNDLETLLRKPFNSENIATNDQMEPNFYSNQTDRSCNVDLDNDISNRVEPDLNGAAVIESSYLKSNRESEKMINDFEQVNLSAEQTIQAKSSRAIDEVECDRVVDDGMVELQYPAKKKSRLLDRFVNFEIEPIVLPERPPKRKGPARTLKVDQSTTISHQVLRDNMKRERFCLVEKNSLFPNGLISRSRKAQIACSANSLFEYPGNYALLHSRPLLAFWRRRRLICAANVKTVIGEYKVDYVPPRVTAATNDVMEVSDMSIEHVRGRESSKRVTIQMDSFTFGSDSLQRSIIQSSFEADKTLEDIDRQVFDDPVVVQVDMSMLPIIEEDVRPSCVAMETGTDEAIVDKSGVWRTIKHAFQNRLERGDRCSDVRVSFYELCPRGRLRREAATFFITILRLAKYRKIRLFQDKLDTDIFIGLPLSAVDAPDQ